MKPSLVVVVIPIYKQAITVDERTSLVRCLEILGNHDLMLVAPQGLDLSNYLTAKPNLKVSRFPANYFEGISGYNKLLKSADFYKRFLRYEFMLIYQLDCYVFRDELLDWCYKGFDYVGAPWFEGFQPHNGKGFWSVGNGGFSLRKVRSALNVLLAWKVFKLPPIDRNEFARLTTPRKIRHLGGRFLRGIGWRNNSRYMIKRFNKYEDIFWSQYAQLIDPDFRIAPIHEALAFSFEHSPRYCFEQNGSRLPFGCHGWNRYETEFWQSFIIKTPESL